MSVFSLVRPWEIPSLGVATPLQSTGTLPLFFYRGPSPQTWRCWFSFELLPAGLLTTLAECYHLIKPKETNHLQKAEATLRPSNQRFSIGAVRYSRTLLPPLQLPNCFPGLEQVPAPFQGLVSEPPSCDEVKSAVSSWYLSTSHTNSCSFQTGGHDLPCTHKKSQYTTVFTVPSNSMNSGV